MNDSPASGTINPSKFKFRTAFAAMVKGGCPTLMLPGVADTPERAAESIDFGVSVARVFLYCCAIGEASADATGRGRRLPADCVTAGVTSCFDALMALLKHVMILLRITFASAPSSWQNEQRKIPLASREDRHTAISLGNRPMAPETQFMFFVLAN